MSWHCFSCTDEKLILLKRQCTYTKWSWIVWNLLVRIHKLESPFLHSTIQVHDLQFEFPFYGHTVDRVAITTAGTWIKVDCQFDLFTIYMTSTLTWRCALTKFWYMYIKCIRIHVCKIDALHTVVIIDMCMYMYYTIFTMQWFTCNPSLTRKLGVCQDRNYLLSCVVLDRQLHVPMCTMSCIPVAVHGTTIHV